MRHAGREIVWTAIAQKDFGILYIIWKAVGLQSFKQVSAGSATKNTSVTKQPNIGYKSSKHSRFRQTLVTRHYKLIYSVKRNHIVILRLKHTSMK
jgi:hypothetical protein